VVGDSYYPDDAPGLWAKCFVTNTWSWFYCGYPVTLPPSSGWTAFSNAAIATAGVRTFRAVGGDFQGEVRAPALNTVVMGLAWGGVGVVGGTWKENADAQLVMAGNYVHNGEWRSARYAAWNGGKTADYFTDPCDSAPRMFWLKFLQPGAGNRVISISFDGLNFDDIVTQAYDLTITPDRVGYIVSGAGSARVYGTLTLFHYAESTT